MASRRSHPKSRNGCIICKQRKVKCDESRPTCANCLRYGVSCVYAPPKIAAAPVPAAARLPTRALPSQSPDNASSQSTDSQTTFTDLGILANSNSTISTPSGVEQCREFELLHHYCTCTADSLSQSDKRHIWKVVLPQVGYQYDFVRHGVLALSAIHKAYLNPSQRRVYLDLAAHYQSQGLSGFRAMLPRITYNNWRAVFCFATMVIVYVYSLPLRADDLRLEDPIRNLLELFTVVRGLRVTLEPFIPLISKTEFAPVITGIWLPQAEEKSIPSLEHTLLPPDTFTVISSLRLLLQGELPLSKTQHYDRAIDALEMCTKLLAYAGSYIEPGMVIWWPCALDETILKDVESFDPHALVLLAHFLVFMNITERINWSVKGWGKPVLDDIERRLHDHPGFVAHLRWPKSHINQ
ncbi:hypothetical protein F4774DRAFT_140546 [Daldinia eschscholtzii]|nr:hypothetical protein F4774DRAFT_140546 [Daldinia eschscholtzii]